MNIYNTLLTTVPFYFPIGNTPPICLTQDLPPEQTADILLLGCGDARHVLFTCFADNTRKMDITCCDIEPMIHARNVLLYTLLIEDKTDSNIENIWNIYYNLKISEKSLELLESQTNKLLALSESIDQWQSSVYGSTIRFCDKNSLSTIRSYWLGFTTQDLTPAQKEDRLSQLQSAIDRTHAHRPLNDKKSPEGTGYRSTFPTAKQEKAWEDLVNVSKQWWDYGTVPSSNLLANHTHLNPALLYSPDNSLIIYYATSPLGGTSLSTVYTSVDKETVFYLESKGMSTTERLVACAKNHFKQWSAAFRRSVTAGLVIRIFSGDTATFCLTLRNCQLTGLTSMNLFCHNSTNSPLILHDSDYGPKRKNAAPLSFDVIDTSNIIDYLGPLNVLTLGSCLLKHHVSSCLYTELLVMFDLHPMDRFSDFFCVEVRSIALLLGLVPPDLSTNAANTVEEFKNAGSRIINENLTPAQAFSRLRWRRSGGASCASLQIQVNASEFTKLMIRVYEEMFKLDDVSLFKGSLSRNIECQKLHFRPYTRGSFAFILSILTDNVVCDWYEFFTEFYQHVISVSNPAIMVNRKTFMKDLVSNMRVFGVDKSQFFSPVAADRQHPILASVLSKCKDLPDHICVTTQVPRERLKGFKVPGTVGILCTLEAEDPIGGDIWVNSFTSVQIVFGKLRKQTELNLCIEEDSARLAGTSDMFVSVMIPTAMISKRPARVMKSKMLVKCRLRLSPAALKVFGDEFGPQLCFYSSELTNKNVYITKFMPGMLGLPTFAETKRQNNVASIPTSVRFSPDGFKITTLIQRITLRSEVDKALLALQSSPVKLNFKSPLMAVVTIAGSLELKFEFPVPVSLSKYYLRIARKSSYIEIESSFLNPVEEDVPTFLFPTLLSKVSFSVIPTAWTAMHVDLDVMPRLDLDATQGLYGSWLHEYAQQMFSVREAKIRNTSSEKNFRIKLKTELLNLFRLSTGHEGQKVDFFGLQRDEYLHTLIVPSCLRLNLANNTVVLDCAVIPLTNTVSKDPSVSEFLKELTAKGLYLIEVTEAENLAWKAMTPAMVERCRTWKHKTGCEYVQAGEVPLPNGLNDDREPCICSCGVGKFPSSYLKNQIEKFPALKSIIDQHATRAAISLLFAIPYVEDCKMFDPMRDNCQKCGGTNNLLTCSRCKKVKYCSEECQKDDLKDHKKHCKKFNANQ